MSREPALTLARLWRGPAGALARAAFAAVPIVWIATRVDLGALPSRLRAVGLLAIVASLGAMFACFALGTLRWRTLLRAYGAAPLPPFGELLRHVFVGHYYNLLPGGVAGDFVRASRVAGNVGGLPTSLAVLFVDRVCGLLGLAAIALVGASLGAHGARSGVDRTVALAIVAASATGSFVLVAALFGGKLAGRLSRLPIVGPALASIRRPTRPRDLVLATLLSVGTQGATIASMLFMVAAASPTLQLATALQVAPLVVLLLFVPLTPGGVGQREAIFIELWGRAGVAAVDALAASLAYFAIGIVIALAGGAVAWAERLGLWAHEPAPPDEPL